MKLKEALHYIEGAERSQVADEWSYCSMHVEIASDAVWQ